MAWKFLNIGKANAEIERLQAEVATVTKERDDARAALTDNHSETVSAAESLQTNLTAAQADLVTAKASVASLGAQVTKLEADLKVANEKLANPEAQVVQIASRRALEITQAQGQAPVVNKGGENTGDVIEQFNAIKDPQARTEFYRKHKAAFDAAWRAKTV
jgi:predicted  nucleic acid-binding Zn-ribbon protein